MDAVSLLMGTWSTWSVILDLQLLLPNDEV
jgi:hypothetical protein